MDLILDSYDLESLRLFLERVLT